MKTDKGEYFPGETVYGYVICFVVFYFYFEGKSTEEQDVE
jgi:hypothetical protein